MNLQMYNARALTVYCEAYFLRHFGTLLHNDDFRRMVYSSKMRIYDLPHGVLEFLTKLLSKKQQKLKTQKQDSTVQPPPPPPLAKR